MLTFAATQMGKAQCPQLSACQVVPFAASLGKLLLTVARGLMNVTDAAWIVRLNVSWLASEFLSCPIAKLKRS